MDHDWEQRSHKTQAEISVLPDRVQWNMPRPALGHWHAKKGHCLGCCSAPVYGSFFSLDQGVIHMYRSIYTNPPAMVLVYRPSFRVLNNQI